MKPFIIIPVCLFLLVWLILGSNVIGGAPAETNQPATLIDQLIKEGNELLQKGDAPGALAKFEASVKAAETLGDKKALIDTWLRIAGTLVEQAAYQEDSRKAFEQAKRLAEELDDKSVLASVLGLLGRAQVMIMGQYREGMENFQKALRIHQERNDKGGIAVTLSNIGLFYEYQGYYPEALDYFHRAMEASQEAGSTEPNPNIAYNLGVVYEKLSLYGQAAEYIQTAHEIWEREGGKLGIALAVSAAGSLYAKEGLYDRAIEHSQKALALYTELGSKHRMGVTLDDIGNIYAMQRLWDQALAYYQKAQTLWRESGNKRRMAGTLSAIGAVYAMQGSYTAALPYYEEALRIGRELGVQQQTGEALIGLGRAQLKLQKYAQAMETLQQALAIGEEIKEFDVLWQARYHLAIGYEKLGQLDLALKYYQSAIEEIEKIRTGVSSDEGRAGYFQDKIEVYEHLIDLLTRWHTKDPTKGYHALAFQYAERGRARAFLDLLAEAKVNVEQGIDAALLGRRREIHARISEIQARLIKQYSVKSPDLEKVKTLEADLAKVDDNYQTLQQEIRRRNPGYADLQYPEPIQLDAAQRLLGEKTLLLEYLVGEGASFLFAVSKTDYLVARLPRASALHDRVKTLREAMARPGTDLSSYVTQARWLYQELIRPAGKLLSGKEELIIVADGILHYLPFEVLLRSDSARPAQIDLRTLPYLVRNYAITYVPSASVLAGLLRERPASHRPQKMLLAYADPIYGKREPEKTSVASVAVRSAFGEGKPWRLKPLTQSRREVEGIAKLYPKDAVALFLGDEAREENVKAEGRLSQYRILHFAVHGLLNENKPQFSGLVLSLPVKIENKSTSAKEPRGKTDATKMNGTYPLSVLPPPEDGLLQVYEIFNLKLAADLVVLSACETGLGKEIKGEGLMGLTRAFLYAGTPSLVVSLWKVADRSTSELMLRFYKHLKIEKLSKAEALRRAQLELIGERTLAHPYYWAPFVLVGKP